MFADVKPLIKVPAELTMDYRLLSGCEDDVSTAISWLHTIVGMLASNADVISSHWGRNGKSGNKGKYHCFIRTRGGETGSH